VLVDASHHSHILNHLLCPFGHFQKHHQPMEG
jgi:hypothetical protein